MVTIDLEKLAAPCHNNNLQHYNTGENDPKQTTLLDVFEKIKFVFDSSAAYEIEDLQKHKCIVYKGKVPAIHIVLIEPFYVVVLP